MNHKKETTLSPQCLDDIYDDADYSDHENIAISCFAIAFFVFLIALAV